MTTTKSTTSKKVSLSNDQAKATLKTIGTTKTTSTSTKAKAKTTTAKKSAPKAEATIAQAKPARIERVAVDILDPCESPTQLPDRFCQETLDRYTELMKDGLWDWSRTSSFPILFKDKRGEYHIGDGHHTIESSQNANITDIDCLVQDGDLNDALEYSYSKANRLHGLAITNAAKFKLVIETIKNPQMLERIAVNLCSGTSKDIPSSRAISKWIGIVSPVYVGNIWDRLIMNKLGDDHPWLLAKTRIGLDGKRSKVTPPTPPAPAPPAPPAPAPEPVVNAAAAPAEKPIDKEYGEPKLNAHNAIVITPQTVNPPDDTAPSEPISTQAARLQIDGLAAHYAHKIISEVNRYKGFEGLELLPQVQENIQKAIVNQLLAILSKT